MVYLWKYNTWLWNWFITHYILWYWPVWHWSVIVFTTLFNSLTSFVASTTNGCAGVKAESHPQAGEAGWWQCSNVHFPGSPNGGALPGILALFQSQLGPVGCSAKEVKGHKNDCTLHLSLLSLSLIDWEQAHLLAWHWLEFYFFTNGSDLQREVHSPLCGGDEASACFHYGRSFP